MLDQEQESALLRQAVSRGLLTTIDIQTDRQAALADHSTVRFGPRLDRLLAEGKLTSRQIATLSAELSAFDQTLDGTAHPALSAPHSEVVSIQSPSWLTEWSAYEVLGVLGQGGMGVVYRALDRKLAREVALKFISSTDDQLRRRFLTEARSQARLNHEHICKVYEVGEVQGQPYIAMELVRGKSLSVLQRTLNREQRLTLMRDIAQAVHVAHSHGIIHRDLKPSNIVVEEKEDGSLRPVVMDFGLARDQSSEEHLTMTGMVMGTPAYMSPEQAQGEVSRIDRRSDVYSLGAMLYELLSGRLPFAGETTVAMILQVVQSEPTPLRKVNAEIPVDLETIVLTAMAKEVQRRYDTARALAEDLDRFLTGEPIQARKASVIYVLYKRAQKHRVLVVISALCLLSVIALLSLSVRSRMLAARERARAERQSAFSQQLGQDITQMELFMRAATMQPAHDLGREQNVVRARMNKIAQQLPGLPVELRGPTYYALGRGHYVLQEHAQARGLLEQALAVGYDRPEVHVTLGLSLGQLYLQGISALKGELDPVRRKQRRAKLDEELLSATRRHLAQSAGSEIDSPKLIEGWIHFYREDLASAQQAAEIAARETPWDFEPLKLQLLIAVRQFEQQVLQMKLSEFDAMTDRLAEKIQRLSDLARSDPLAATMRILILQQRLMRDIVDHRPLDADFRKILAAIDQFGVLVPNSPLIFAEKASAYAYLARRQEEIGEDPRPAARTAEEAMDDAVRAGDRSPHLNILRNNLLLAMASYADKHGEDPRPYMQRAAAVLESTALQHKGLLFLWNDLCVSECLLAEQEIIHGQDPRTFLKRGLAACETAIRLNSSVSVPYQNLACLYREQTRYQIQKGEPFDLSKGLQALAMAEQRKPEDSDSANTELQLRVLSAHALWSQQRDPSQELRAAESVAEKLRSIYPHDVGTYQSRGELLLAYLALSRDLPAESGLRTELAALDEGITRYPDVAGLRFLKAKLLLVLSTRLKTQPEQRQITESLALLEGLRPMLLHRAEYHMVRAEAKRLQATSRSGAMRAQTLLAAQQAEQEAKQINPLEPPFVGTRASIQSPFAHP